MEIEELKSLLNGVKEGNPKAQTKLIHHFWEDVFSFILKKTGDHSLSDELTVAVFAKVLAKIHLYDDSFQFKTWMLTIAQNSVIDYWRKKAREETFREDLKEVKNEWASSPEEILISKQQQQHIINTIASLDSNYRKIVELRFFEEKSIKEIAEELNISVANTKVRIMRAKRILAELLKNI
ncbi:MAG: sigma-70 family RNA polymerase sigma factor [Flavobacteriaceae bacterium]|nr:sigma-70 family RNA polymerase sigma factor [Flavobacteriaceae bacterium]